MVKPSGAMDELLTDHDILLEIVCLALSDPEMSAADLLERVESLGRSELIEEARTMQEILDDDEDDGVDPDLDPAEDPP